MSFPVEEKFIAESESKLGYNFPFEWRDKLKNKNGGELEIDEEAWRIFPIYDSSDRKRIGRTANDVVRETASAKSWTGFPTNAVAIGTNDSGDFLILLPSNGDANRLENTISIWRHETRKIESLGLISSLGNWD